MHSYFILDFIFSILVTSYSFLQPFVVKKVVCIFSSFEHLHVCSCNFITETHAILHVALMLQA